MSAPSYDVDFYSDAFIREPWGHYAAMRALGPLVWLPQQGNYALTRHREVAAALRDPETFYSGKGVAGDKTACDLMQGNSIASDGERHNAIRVAMAGPLLPGALEEVRPLIEALAEDLIERLIARDGFDAMEDLAAHLPLTVVRDLVGLPDFGKENMLRWGAAAFDLLGVQNARGQEALKIFMEQREFIRQHATREALKEGSWTRRIHELVDDGALSNELAPFCIRDYINPSLDTTISATGQLLWQFAKNPEQWKLLREKPELATRAVNEAVRLGTPIRSFSRHAARDVKIGDHLIEEGSRVMVLYASANRDELEFEEPDAFRISRNPKQHLGFGSGIHMCVGMHLAQLEMVSLLKAMIPRVERIHVGDPVMALNNTIYSFAHLPARFEKRASYQPLPFGCPQVALSAQTQSKLINARVVQRSDVAENIAHLVLESDDGTDLPIWTPGSHIDVHVRSGLVRQYSLTGLPDPKRYRVAVQKETNSRGGSVEIYRRCQAGASIRIGQPRNNFPLVEGASFYALFSGGIGLTPIMAMAWRLYSIGTDFVWHVSARSRVRLPFADELDLLPFRDKIMIHLDDCVRDQKFDASHAFQEMPEGSQVYVCGPNGFMDYIADIAKQSGVPANRLHKEHFGAEIDVTGEPFALVARKSGKSVEVASGETIVAALNRIGIEVETACQNGVCGTCLTKVIEGRPDHRDIVLTDIEKASNERIAACCSRSLSRTLILDI